MSFNYINDDESIRKLRKRLSKVTEKYNRIRESDEPKYSNSGQGLLDKIMEVALSPETEEYCNEQQKIKEQMEEAERIGNEVFSQMTVISEKNTVSEQILQNPVQSDSTIPATIAEYVLEFENRIQKYSICFPYGKKFKNDKKYASKMGKKMKRAVSILKNRISVNDILVYSDLSIWGSGKEFFIITEKCIYHRYSSGINQFEYTNIKNGVEIKEIDKVVKEGNIEVYVNSLYASSFHTKEEAEALKEMVYGCIAIARDRQQRNM